MDKNLSLDGVNIAEDFSNKVSGAAHGAEMESNKPESLHQLFTAADNMNNCESTGRVWSNSSTVKVRTQS